MKLTLQGLQEKEQWKNAGIGLPSYDIEKVAEETKKYFPYFYRRDRRYTDIFRRDEKRDYLCGNV